MKMKSQELVVILHIGCLLIQETEGTVSMS